MSNLNTMKAQVASMTNTMTTTVHKRGISTTSTMPKVQRSVAYNEAREARMALERMFQKGSKGL